MRLGIPRRLLLHSHSIYFQFSTHFSPHHQRLHRHEQHTISHTQHSPTHTHPSSTSACGSVNRHPFDTHCLIIMKNEIEFLLHFHWIHLENHNKHNHNKHKQNLDALHDHLGTLYPGMRAPSFRCTEKDGELLLHYYSERPGLEHIVIGIVKVHVRSISLFPLSLSLPCTRPPFTLLIFHRPLHRSCTASRWKSK